MAGINEFLIFDENNQNTMTNQAYSTDDQRLNGVSTGIARSALYNKTMRQSSVMVNAIANYMSNKNIDAREDETIKEAIKKLFSAENINFGEGNNIDEILEDSMFKIGDIKETYRTDLGENWALCNGDVIDAEKYPEISSIAPPVETFLNVGVSNKVEVPSENTTESVISISNVASNGVTKAFVVLLEDIRNSQTLYTIYSDDNFETIGSYKITGDLQSSYFYFDNSYLFYVNDTWILFGSTDSGMPGSISVGKTSNIKNNSWSLTKKGGLYGEVGLDEVFDVWYENGKYYAAVSGSATASLSNIYPFILESSTPGFESIQYYKGTTTQMYPYGFVRNENAIVFLGYYNTKTYLCYTKNKSNFSNSFILKEISNVGYKEGARTFSYYNGLYITIYATSKTSPNDITLKCYYTDNLENSTWNENNIDNTFLPANYSILPYKLLYYRGKYIAIALYPVNGDGKYYLYVFDDVKSSKNLEIIQLSAKPISVSETGYRIYKFNFRNLENTFVEKDSIFCLATGITRSGPYSEISCVRFKLLCLPINENALTYKYMKVK